MTEGLDEILWCCARIRQAGSAREIAGQLLRIPDGIIFTHGARLQVECVDRQFVAGATFILLREQLLSAVRDVHGLLPTSKSLELESWRATLSAYASGRARHLPDFMGGTRVANSQG